MAQANARTQINIAARNSRAAVVSANRQRWIDAVRDDVALFISTRKRRDRLRLYAQMERGWFHAEYGMEADSMLTNPEDAKSRIAKLASNHEKENDLDATLTMLSSRIEMRLNTKGHFAEKDHLDLVEILSKFERGRVDEDYLMEVAQKIFKFEWERLKKEASGLRHFVREAPLP